MLREHFRCVPAIIGYSNRFYNLFMQPLRIPKQSERVDPPLVDVFVPVDYRDKKDINRPEAELIVTKIQAILADTQFAGRTLAWCRCSDQNRPGTSTRQCGPVATPAN